MDLKLTPAQEEDLTWAEKIVRNIDEKGINLSSWEIDFIASLDEQIKECMPLTEAQLDKLAEIFHQRC